MYLHSNKSKTDKTALIISQGGKFQEQQVRKQHTLGVTVDTQIYLYREINIHIYLYVTYAH